MTTEKNEKNEGEDESDAVEPPEESHVDHRKSGALWSAGQDEQNRTTVRVERHSEPKQVNRGTPYVHEEVPAWSGAPRPEPEAFVHEMFRKTELYDKPPTADRGDRVIRRNSLRYLAGQVDSILDRLALVEHRLDRAIARLDRRIAELQERGR